MRLNDMPDGNAAAERQHVHEEAIAEALEDDARALAKQRAAEDMGDSDVVADMLCKSEYGGGVHIARCFRELKGACRGDQLSIIAITSALHFLKRDMQAAREKDLFDTCLREIKEGVF